MIRLPIQPDSYLEADWQLLKDEYTRIYEWSYEDLERRVIACESIASRAVSSGQRGIALEAYGRAEAWGDVRRELVTRGLQASVDMAWELVDYWGGGA